MPAVERHGTWVAGILQDTGRIEEYWWRWVARTAGLYCCWHECIGNSGSEGTRWGGMGLGWQRRLVVASSACDCWQPQLITYNWNSSINKWQTWYNVWWNENNAMREEKTYSVTKQHIKQQILQDNTIFDLFCYLVTDATTSIARVCRDWVDQINKYVDMVLHPWQDMLNCKCNIASIL